MELPLTIMMLQGLLGAVDTIYYHEYKYRLPVHGPKVRGELRLHAFRDFVYGLLFITLPRLTWQGVFAYFLAALIVLEICITIWDFNIEVVERADIGGVANTERGLHLVMAVVYGFFLAHLLPELIRWSELPSGWGITQGVGDLTVVTCSILGVGVLLSGLRDLLAASGVKAMQIDLFGRV